MSFAASQVTSKNSEDKKLKETTHQQTEPIKQTIRQRTKKKKEGKLATENTEPVNVKRSMQVYPVVATRLQKAGLILWSYHKTKRKHKNLTKS